MKRTIMTLGLALILLAGVASAFPQENPASKPDRSRILGTWLLEGYAGEMVISMTLVLEEAEGKLAGKISEATGMFIDSHLGNIAYEGETLTYDINVSTPPDGAVRTWKTRLKIGADAAEGEIYNADLGMSLAISARRAKK
jgi:hypothetical protein